MGTLLEKISTALAVLAAFLLLFVTSSISYAILTRVLGLDSPVWVVQFNEYALLWITFLATSWILASDKHVSIDLITGKIGPRWKTRMSLVHALLGAGVCGILTYYGSLTVVGQFQRGVIDVKAVDVPKSLVLLVIPLGFGLLFLQFLLRFIRTIRTPPAGNPADAKSVQALADVTRSPLTKV